MSYDYLGLTNYICNRINEVELSESNFSSANGVYADAKNAVNAAIRKINQEEFEWPFNHNTQTDTLTAGTNRYNVQADFKSLDIHSFRIPRDAAFNNTTRCLTPINYEDYLRGMSDDEYNTGNSSVLRIPEYVARTPDGNYLVWPVPDQDYNLIYEYYALQTELVNATDVPTVPEAFRWVINHGSMYYAYTFRGDTESADRELQLFRDGISDMRKIYTNRFLKVTDGRVNNGRLHYSTVLRTS